MALDKLSARTVFEQNVCSMLQCYCCSASANAKCKTVVLGQSLGALRVLNKGRCTIWNTHYKNRQLDRRICEISQISYHKKDTTKSTFFLHVSTLFLSLFLSFSFSLSLSLCYCCTIFLFISDSLILGVGSIFCLLLFYGYNQTICSEALHCVCASVWARTRARACQSEQKHCWERHSIATNHTTSCTQTIWTCCHWPSLVCVVYTSVAAMIIAVGYCVRVCLCVCAWMLTIETNMTDQQPKQHGGCL